MPKPLIISVDIRFLRAAKTGSLTYLKEICNEFEKINSDEIQFHFLDSNLPIYTGNVKVLKWIEHLRYQLWKQLTLPLKAFFKNSDIVFCADECVPLIHLRYKTILAMHDAFFFETPESYGKLWSWVYLNTAIPSAKRSAFVVTLTLHSKKQILRYTDIDADKLVVVNPGAKLLDENIEVGDQSIQNKYGIVSGSYMLHVGAMFKRKNIPALIHAFNKIRKMGYPDLKLVLGGPLPNNQYDNDYQVILNAIKSSDLQNEIILTGYLTDSELNQLYSNALIYVFPSINEGFGIPVLEAFKHSLPVLVANNTCLPEVGGDAVLQFDPFDIDDITLKIKTVLDNEDLRKDMIIKGHKREKQFSWHKTASQLTELFKKAI
jgi:glycosyltransferase involved in cell wall biosynthesis